MRPVREAPIRLSAPRACFCSGPRPGHDLCPCRERSESDQDRRIRLLEAEVRRLRGVASRGRMAYLLTMRFGPARGNGG